jgi:hypothetical protein
MISANVIHRGFPIVVFAAAFLSFLIQPIAGKVLTPQYGGSAAVWCICLLFFQICLLAGYGLAIRLNRLSPKRALWTTAIMFAASAFVVRIPREVGYWTPASLDEPVLSLLQVITTHLLLPCVLLSATGLVVQHWSHLLSRSPYWLYSVSNVGAISALIGYPVGIEPFLGVSSSLNIFNWVFAGFALSMSMLAVTILVSSNMRRLDVRPDTITGRPALRECGKWLLASFTGAALLVTTTRTITSDIASVPLLWISALIIYLFTFVLTFSSRCYYNRILFASLAQALLVINVGLRANFSESSPLLGIANNLGVLFLLCMVCHGELIMRRPDPLHLGSYYLAIAIGGVSGGIASNLVAPLLFKSTVEYQILAAVGGWWTVYLLSRTPLAVFRQPVVKRAYVTIAFAFLLIPTMRALRSDPSVIHLERNFYNGTRVVRNSAANALGLYSGRTIHGFQLQDASKQQIPTAYYSVDSAIGILDAYLREQQIQPIKFAAIGLGTGTIAAYGRSGDSVVFYELDPKIKSIAEKYFTFLGESKANVDVRLGDARQTMGREDPQQYDLLIVDAFSGDSVPHHLVTREAMRLYLNHLNPRGIVTFHVTNHYLDLASVVNNIALSMNLDSNIIHTVKGKNPYAAESRYVVVARPGCLEAARLADLSKPYTNVTIGGLLWNPRVGLWTDDYVNLLGAIRIAHGHGHVDARFSSQVMFRRSSSAVRMSNPRPCIL